MAEEKIDKEQKSTPETFSVSSGIAKKSHRPPNFKFPNLNDREDFKKFQPANWGRNTLIVAFIILSVLCGFGGAWLESNTSINNGTVTVGTLSKQEKVVTSQSQLINQIAKSVGPSVVSVNVNIDESSTGSSSSSDGFGLFGFSQPEEEQAAGTGIIISSQGLIITNRHVVPAGTTNVSVTLSDGTELKDVSVIGRTPATDSLDIAFLKINNTEGHKLTPAVIGDSSTVQVGDSVVAIGNALGQFQNTVTSGIISGYGRSVQAGDSSGTGSTENLDDLFQTDAAINEGNSGGPLVNLNGQVIGINTAIAGNAQNIGFAIPINDARGLLNQVLKTGKFSVPYLGIRYIPLTSDVANEYNLKTNNGAFIAPSSDSSSPSIVSGSPADKAGLKVNDIITAVNGININQSNSLTSLLDQHIPGNNITLTVLRGSSTVQINVTLGSEPNS
jgi:serine protease Do